MTSPSLSSRDAFFVGGSTGASPVDARLKVESGGGGGGARICGCSTGGAPGIGGGSRLARLSELDVGDVGENESVWK